MGREVFRFSRPISTAARARSLSSSTSFLSSSSIFFRQSSMSIKALLSYQRLPAAKSRALRLTGQQLRLGRTNSPNPHALHKLSHRCRLRARFRSTVSTIALPTTTASANSPTSANCSAVEIPNPTATGNLVTRRNRRTSFRASSASCCRSRHSGSRYRIYKSARSICNPLQAFIRAGRRRQKHRSQIVRSHHTQIFAGLFHRQIGDQGAVHASGPRDFAKSLHAHAQNRIEIGKHDQSRRLRVLPILGRQRQHLPQRSPVFQGTLTGSLNHRTVRHWIAEWHPEFNHICPASIAAKHNFARGGEVRIAAGYVDYQRRLFIKSQGHRKLLIVDF